MEEHQSLNWIRERDIDLLFSAEMYGKTGFADWFFSEIGLQDASFTKARVSATDVYGETDVLIEAEVQNNSHVIILVEHKISAAFQKDQDGRYKQRANTLMRDANVVAAMTVLIAPDAYVSSSNANFDKTISFEKIMAWLIKSADSRSAFFARALSVAIQYQNRGYQPVVHEGTTAFWTQYYNFVSSEYPELNMSPPGDKAAAASFCYFRSAFDFNLLGRNEVLVHKWIHGHADLQFSQTTPQFLKEHLKLKNPMMIAKASKSSSVRVKVPKLDSHSDFTDQLDKVVEGLNAIKELHTLAHQLRDDEV